MLELAGILLLGVLAQWIAWRIKLPAIFPLIIIGLAVGPLATLISPEGTKLINPDNIFEGKMMFYFVSLSVGVILFEGGLTLKFKEVRHLADTMRNILILGTIIMFIGGGIAAYYLVGLDWRVSLLFGSLIIVTGPTVINPLLQSVHPNKNIATILKWEGILIDPIGALVAVLTYELLFAAHAGHGHGMGEIAMRTFFLTISVGTIFGLFSGWLLHIMLKKNLIPKFLMNVIALGMVVFAFAGADQIQPESGLLSVVVMGIFLANVPTPNIEKILDFKEDLTVILISLLFIILSAKIEVDQLMMLGVGSLLVLLVTVFILRPMVVFGSAIKSDLTFKEKIFISWIGPKGIVAAAIASLFALYISENESIAPELREQATLLVPLTFIVILGTVTLNGLTAKPIANWLGVVRKTSNGFLLVGANEIGIAIGRYLMSQNTSVTLIDTSHSNIVNAEARGLHCIEANVIGEEVNEELELEDVGRLVALTSSNDINLFACSKFRKSFGAERVFRLITVNEMKHSIMNRPKNVLFGGDADYIRLMDLVRKYPDLREMPIDNGEHLERILTNEDDELIPIFVRRKAGELKVITATYEVNFEAGDQLVYIGKAIA